jgi:hypothetical protein
VSVLVAILTVVLVGVAAFTADFGVAYANKRQLQTSTDAGALAAAQELAKVPGGCAAIAGNTAAIAAAQAIADDYATRNRQGQTRVGPLAVRCSQIGQDGLATNAALVVGYTSTRTTEAFFGRLFGVNDLAATRTASAAVEPAPTSGLRPYGICAQQINGFNPLSPVKFKILFPKNSSADTAGCTTPTGNWYTLKCPEDSNNSSSNLAEKTEFGCLEEAAIVAGQPDPPANSDAVLEAACSTGRDVDCLGGNPGNFPGPVFDAWDKLLGQVVIFPVFSGTAVVDPNGNNAKYPVQSFLGAKVCGYNFGQNGNANQWGNSTDPACAGLPEATGTNDENYLVILPAVRVTSGTTKDALCALGQTGGDCGNDSVRRVRLIR